MHHMDGTGRRRVRASRNALVVFSGIGADHSGHDHDDLVGQPVFVRPGRDVYGHVDDHGYGQLDSGDGLEFQNNGNTITNCNSQLLSGVAGTYTATCDEPANSLLVGDSQCLVFDPAKAGTLLWNLSTGMMAKYIGRWASNCWG
jgi:hypothetical protein